MVKKLLASLFLPALVLLALCPLGAPQAFADTHSFTINADPPSGGTVYCPEIGSGYSIGASLEEGTYYVSATPYLGYQFDGFYENDVWVGNNGDGFYLGYDRTIVARFSLIPVTHSLTVAVGQGKGSIYCAELGGWGTFLNGTVNEGSVYLEASPDYSYQFEGWYVGGSYYSSDLAITYPVYSDSSIEARFYWVPITHNVSYDPSGGGGTTVYTVEQENSTFYLPNPADLGFSAPAGCAFDSWSIFDGTTYSTGNPGDAAWMGTGDLQVFAVWAPVAPVFHNVIFVTYEGSGSMPSLSVAEGDSFVVPECGFTPAYGRVFDHWSLGTKPGETIKMGTTDILLEAVWKDAPLHKVFLDPHGGTGYMADPYIPEGFTYTVPECTFTPPEGKHFAGWWLDGVGMLWPGNVITVTKDISLVVHWEDTWCTVFIMPNGGTGLMPDPMFIYGTLYTLPECTFTPPEGKKFAGWDLGKPGTQIKLTSDLTITAQWVDKDKPARYSFSSGNGASWRSDSPSGLGFAITRSVDNDKTFDIFKANGKVTVDGKEVPSRYYTVSSGSLKLVLTPEFLSTLSPGKHTLEVSFGDGAATGSFSVMEAPSPKSETDSTPEPSGSDDGNEAIAPDPDNQNNQNNGTDSKELPIIPILLGVIAAALIAILLVLLLRRKKDDDRDKR